MSDETDVARLAEALYAGIPELSLADCELIAGAALPVVREIADQRAAEELEAAARLRETVARVEALAGDFGQYAAALPGTSFVGNAYRNAAHSLRRALGGEW